MTGSYDRGEFFDVSSPQSQFHTYAVNWTLEQLTWMVDGVIVRTLYAADCDDATHQYPQTPAKLQLGLWDGGDSSGSSGTVNWAGGYTNLSLAPFTMYVKSVTISGETPAYAYNYTDQSGTWESIEVIQKPESGVVSNATSSTTQSSISASASSSVLSQISSSLASMGSQFAGTAATPSMTASSVAPTASSTVTSSSIPLSSSKQISLVSDTAASASSTCSIKQRTSTQVSTILSTSTTSTMSAALYTTTTQKTAATTSKVTATTAITEATVITTTATSSKAPATTTTSVTSSKAPPLPAWLVKLPRWMQEHIYYNRHGWFWWW